MIDINNDGYLDVYVSVAGLNGIKTMNYISIMEIIHLLRWLESME